MSSNRITVGSPLPAGNNNIGDMDVASVPAPLSTAGGGTEAAALRVTLATDSTGVVSVDDNGGTLSVDDGGGSLTVDGSVAVSNFPATQPVSGTVAISNPTTNPETGLAKDTSLGGLTETAPASDTASSALNGRLQRIAQRLTSLIAVFNIGAGTEAAAVRVTLPTDGTGKVNAAQSGAWTVQPGNTANTTAWKVDGSAVTQPVSNATLPLPTGASTAAKQPALGTAGSPSADVISVQGVASGTPQPVSLPTRTATPTATLTRPADTTAYAAGDSVSSSTTAPTILTFANCVQVSGGTGMIVSASMRDSAYSVPANQGIFELWLLNATTTPDNDNAAFTPTDAEMDTVVKVIRFSLVYEGDKTVGATGNLRYEAPGLNWPFVAVGTSLFGLVKVNGVYTPISAETFKFDLNILQN